MSRTMSRPSPRVYPPPPQQSQQRLVNGYADMEPIGGMDTIARTARVPPPKIFSAGPSAQVRRIESFTEPSTLKILKFRYICLMIETSLLIVETFMLFLKHFLTIFLFQAVYISVSFQN